MCMGRGKSVQRSQDVRIVGSRRCQERTQLAGYVVAICQQGQVTLIVAGEDGKNASRRSLVELELGDDTPRAKRPHPPERIRVD